VALSKINNILVVALSKINNILGFYYSCTLKVQAMSELMLNASNKHGVKDTNEGAY